MDLVSFGTKLENFLGNEIRNQYAQPYRTLRLLLLLTLIKDQTRAE